MNTKLLLLNLTKCFNLFKVSTTLDCRLLNSFSNYISFHSYNCSSFNKCKAYLESLDYLCLEAFSSSFTLMIITDTSAIPPRNMQAISTMHFWRLGYQMLFSKASVGKTTASDAELFAIRLGVLWNALDTNNFYFILFYFSNFILILFCFLFDFEQ